MKIIEMNIYGYGKFENVTFTALRSRQVFFGENEAGKSTIMSFIHSILFGFPTRLQSELRYEPKKGAKYGGSLTVVFPAHGKAVIERVKGKAAGDVSVTMENGRTGGEELLNELLASMDKNLYQAIYSFNLHGLQNVHQMKSEELGRFLFSTGVIGSDRLAHAEHELTKELEARFKPNGRNPLLNVKLKELRQAFKDVKKAEEQNEQYVSLLAQKEALEQEIEAQRKMYSELSQQLARMEEWKKAQPLLHEEKIINEELERFSDILFPENGLQQLERLVERQSALERNQAVLGKRIESLQAELADIKPDVAIICAEQEINRAGEQLQWLQQRKEEDVQLKAKLKNIEDDLVLLQNQLHFELPEEEILGADTSIFMREKAGQLMTKQKRLHEKKQELDEQFEKEQNKLEQLENSVQSLRNELLPEPERKRLKERLAEAEGKELLRERYEEAKERLTFLADALERAKRYKSREKSQYVLLLLLSLVLLAAGWMAELLAMMVLGGVGLPVVLYFLLFKCTPSEEEQLQKEIQKWKKREEAYKEKLKQPEGRTELLAQQLKRDDMLREQLLSMTIKLEEQQRQYDRVIDQYEQWEKDMVDLKAELLAAGRKLNLPEDIAMNYLFDALQIVEALKRKVQEKRQLLEQLSANEKIMHTLSEPLQKLAEQFFPEGDLTSEEVVHALKRRLRLELDKGIKYSEKEEQLHQLQEEWKEQAIELERLIQEKADLFSAAACDNEEQFRQAAAKAAKRKELQERLERVSLQLKMLALDKTERELLASGEPALEALEVEIKAKWEAAAQDEKVLHDRLAQLKHTIQQLEDGGTYADVLHRYKSLQHEFAAAAREWAVFKTAKEMLRKTVQVFKEERLPKMLQRAEEYLAFLTDGQYVRIIPKEEGSGFLIQRKDGLLFEANELSQATTEQIYVSLRLALAVTVYKKRPWPIIIDDSFVNFDRKRTKKVLELLHGLHEHQILFFTCHEHLLSYFKAEEIIRLHDVHTMAGRH